MLLFTFTCTDKLQSPHPVTQQHVSSVSSILPLIHRNQRSREHRSECTLSHDRIQPSDTKPHFSVQMKSVVYWTRSWNLPTSHQITSHHITHIHTHKRLIRGNKFTLGWKKNTCSHNEVWSAFSPTSCACLFPFVWPETGGCFHPVWGAGPAPVC